MGIKKHFDQGYLFTVRVWLEDLGDNRTEWRGRIRSEASGEEHYFCNWPGLLEHLLGMLPDLSAGLPRNAEEGGDVSHGKG